MRHRRSGAVLPVLAVALAAGTGWAAATPAGPQRSVRLELVSTGDAAAPSVTVPPARTLDAAGRLQAARSLQPSARTAAAARAEATTAGLTVTSSTAWQLTVRGPIDLVDRLFGTDPDAPTVPTRWAADVASVVDPTAGQGIWHPASRPAAVASGTQTVANLSQSYGAGVPSTTIPTITAQTPIIATLQFSGWDDGDLALSAPAVYGTAYDPVASGQYTQVGVGRGTGWISGTDGDGTGYQEVALDQETILAAAPELRQRAYITANVGDGLAAALQQVLTDLGNGLPIVALSTSWGSCETDADRTADDLLLQKVTALGVTVFAASGDNGRDDTCVTDVAGTKIPFVGVDFPASDPSVVAVGGTNHPNGAAAPAPDTAWATKTSGSGGGESIVFGRPSWQNGATQSATRAVPDIAADADPNTGVTVTYTDPSGTNPKTTGTIGGTSLSAPLVAGMTGATAARIGSGPGGSPGSGLGDIHSVLYANAATDAVDVVNVEPSAPVHYSTNTPGVGYDEVTGLGTPRMDVLSALLTPAPPATAVTVFAPPPALTLPTVKVSSWSRPDPRKRDAVLKWQVSGGTAALQSFTLTVTQGSKTVTTKTVSAGSRSATLLLSPGTYAVKVTAHTSAGTAAASGKNSTAVPSDAATASGWTTWKRAKDSKAYDGTLTVSAAAGRTLKYSATGSVFGVLLRGSKDGGQAVLLLDGKKVKTVDLYRSRTTELLATSVKASKTGKHTLSIMVLGRHSHGATGNTVAVDAFTSA